MMTGLPAHYRMDRRHAFAGGLVELRRYFWTQPLEQHFVALSDALVINMAITSRPTNTRVDRVEGGRDPLAGQAGRLLVMIPGETYRIAAPSGALRSLHCAIACARFEAVTGEPIDWSALGPFGGETRPGSDIERHMARIHDELVRGGIGSDRAIEAHVELICIALARQFRRGRPARPEVLVGGLAAWRLRAIANRIHADAPAPRLAELAELCGLTERQLGRAFKAETGMTIGRAVEEATMERAHRLLTTTDLRIAEIAGRLGFASADSFATAYRRHTGTSPGKVRRR